MKTAVPEKVYARIENENEEELTLFEEELFECNLFLRVSHANDRRKFSEMRLTPKEAGQLAAKLSQWLSKEASWLYRNMPANIAVRRHQSSRRAAETE